VNQLSERPSRVTCSYLEDDRISAEQQRQQHASQTEVAAGQGSKKCWSRRITVISRESTMIEMHTSERLKRELDQ